MPNTPTRSRSAAASGSRQVVVELPSSRRSARASSSTPTRSRSRATSTTPAHSPHMSKADELAAEEAEEILEHVEGSARSRRHARLSRLRERPLIELGDEVSPSGSVGEEPSDFPPGTGNGGDESNADEDEELGPTSPKEGSPVSS